ncbi:MAG: carboxypeptidase regulatory-like domain-containing protein [Bacteroidaceae bacterium]|nr:carboxypeptidase regulatory-like domain-containing protein [Bacteroidaceae bacterium]
MKRLIYTMLAGLLFAACAEDLKDEIPVGRISGSVSDKNTGEPVATVNATLSPGGNATVTGSDGSFEFIDLSPGEYSVNINKEGYNGNNKTVTVVAGQTTQAHLLIERIPAVITADRTELDFGENYSVNTLSFNIVNNNYEKLSWEMVNNCGWITDVSPKSGSLDYGKTGTIIVKIDRDLLSDGDNTTVLVLSTEGVGSTEITVRAYGKAKKKAVLNTLEVSSVTATTAVLNGEIVDDGYPKYYERGIVLSEQAMPTTEQKLQQLTATMTDDSKYSCQAVGLTLGKTYYVRAYAVNDAGTAYSSNQVSFTTVAVGGKVTMKGIDDIDLNAHTAVAHGEVLEVGDPAYTERGFVYSHTNSSPTIYNSIVKVEGTGKGTFDAKLTNLEREATCYVRAYVKNEAGVTYSENTVTFSTGETLATVETLAATDVDESTYSAVLHGKVTFAGSPSYTERGFVYSTEYSTPTIDDSKVVVSGVGLGEFEARVSGFSSEKITYVRAYVTNNKGTSYGETVQLYDPSYINLPELGIAVQRQDIGHGDRNSMFSLCENSSVGGFTDWRLPTIEELAALYNLKNKIGGFKDAFYWSSSYTRDYHYNNYYYYIDMRNGAKSDISYSSEKFYARAVRTLTK